MDIVQTIKSFNLFDLLVILFLFAAFVLGYVQGSIRRVVGTLSIVASFFVAAVLSEPFGQFLAGNWVNYPREYSYMLGFLTLFVAGVVALFLVVQGTYSKTELFAKHPAVDEVLGGLLGIAQGLLLLMFITIILDQYFLYYPSTAGDFGEVPFLRTFWMSLDASAFGNWLHTAAIPNFLAVVGFLVPDYIEATYANL